MNRLQRLVLVVGIVLVVGMAVFPPWVAERHPSVWREGGFIYGPAQRKSAGYWWITHPPEVEYYLTVSINLGQLAMQEAVALIATAMGVVVFKSRLLRIDCPVASDCHGSALGY